jgi:acetyltransferase
MPRAGELAFISQSGAICGAILDLSLKNKIGFSHFISIGSMLDVDFGDLIDYLGHESDVKSILLYVETLTNVRKFMSAARAISRAKPIIVLKAGRSPAGVRAVLSHTGALAGEDAVYDALFKRAGIVRVNTIAEFFDCAELVSKQPRPSGPNLAVITNSGGPGVMTIDSLTHYGLRATSLKKETMDKLDEILPSHWSHNNPIDILGDATADRYARAVEICIEAREIDAILVILVPTAITDPAQAAESVIQAVKGKRVPLFASWMGGGTVEQGRALLNDAGIPTYNTPEQAVQAFLYMYNYSRNIKMLQEIPPKLHRSLSFDQDLARSYIETGLTRENGLLTEMESKKLLAAYGLPVNRMAAAASMEEAVAAAEDIGYPVVMKIDSPDIVHKTEVGGVQLDIFNEKDARLACDRIREGAQKAAPSASISGVTLQPMVQRPDFELLMGIKNDPAFGPALVFGIGGILTEVLKDQAIGLPPQNRSLARMIMEDTRVCSILKGYRNIPPADLELFEEMIIRLSQLAVDFPQVKELDMNPVMVKGGKPYVVDARVIVQKTDVVSPLHLVISPYPAQYESFQTTSGGLKIFIRPLKPEDAPLFEELFQVLSPNSVRTRFFTPLKKLPPDMLTRFTQIDYDREIALAAFDQAENRERIMGVSRVISEPDGEVAEFAVLVGDPWHGKGVGAKLLEMVLRIGKERGIKTVFGTVLAENTGMLALGRKLGFKSNLIPDFAEYQLTIDLDSLPASFQPKPEE